MSWKFKSFLQCLGKGGLTIATAGRALVSTTKTCTFQHSAQLLPLIFKIKVNRLNGAQNRNYVTEERTLEFKDKHYL